MAIEIRTATMNQYNSVFLKKWLKKSIKSPYFDWIEYIRLRLQEFNLRERLRLSDEPVRKKHYPRFLFHA